MNRSIPHATLVAAYVAAAHVAYADEAPAPAAPARVYHVPPAEAAPGVALAIDATIDHAWQANLELRYRALGDGGAFHAVAFERTSGDAYRASVPANVVAPPGIEYFIASTDAAGAVTLHFASAANPHRVAVHPDEKLVLRERELGRYQGRQARAHVAVENVDFGSRTVNGKELDDRYLRVDADFTYRLLRLPLHSLRFGYTYLLGDTPATVRGDGGCDPDKEDSPGSCTGQAGFKAAGWFELRLRATALLDVDLRGILAATKKGFSVGGRGELRLGSEVGSHVALGAEVLADAGSTGYLRLGWDTVPHFPMAATVELTSLPSSHRATAVRLIYDVAYPLEGGLRLGLRAGYQARDSAVGGLTLGASVALDFD
jgi:hypothetical protein